MNLVDFIIKEAEGKEKPFAVELLTDGVVTIKKYFQTRRLAWAYGENWKMLSGHYDYRICGQFYPHNILQLTGCENKQFNGDKNETKRL